MQRASLALLTDRVLAGSLQMDAIRTVSRGAPFSACLSVRLMVPGWPAYLGIAVAPRLRGNLSDE